MTASAERNTYHHGDARNALLRAASDLLETTGAAGLSLRGLAERAGLSRQAPYNHFADKQTLLAELACEGFDRLGRALELAGRHDAEPIVRLERAALAYITFALATPALFRLMFSKELVVIKHHPAADAASNTAFGRLVEIVTSLVPPNSVADLSLVAWSVVHGYATLCIEAAIEGPERAPERAALFARTFPTSNR